MKTILLISLFFTLNAFANGDWVDLENVKNSNAYWSQKECKVKTGNECGRCQDRGRCMKGLVDNLQSPKFIKIDVGVCTDFDSCQTLLLALDCSPHGIGSHAIMVADFSEVYCAKPNGFNKMDGIVPDAPGIIVADKEDSDKEADELDKKSRRDQCDTDSDLPTMTPKQLSDCIRVLMGK